MEHDFYDKISIHVEIDKFPTYDNKTQNCMRNSIIQTLANLKFKKMVENGVQKSTNLSFNKILLSYIAVKDATKRVDELLLLKKFEKFPVIIETDNEYTQ